MQTTPQVKTRVQSDARARLATLFEEDETAWLEAMSALAAAGRASEMDMTNLGEYLADMAKRDRREVFSRLVTLLTHLLKRVHQSDQHTRSWDATILEQRRELRKLLESGKLYNHAVAVLAEAYAEARKQTAVETGLPLATFQLECPWDVPRLLSDDEMSDA